MRFIGKIATLPVRRHIEEWDDRAQEKKVVQQGIIAVFEQGLLTEYEVLQGLEQLGPFTGLPILEDDQVPVSPRKLLRVYDTDMVAQSDYWDDATKKQVEQFLLNHALYGRDFIAVETPRLPAPWPAYPKLVAKNAAGMKDVVKKILAKIDEDGYAAAAVLAYEVENLNRPEIVAALQNHLPAEPEVDVDAAVAASAPTTDADALIEA